MQQVSAPDGGSSVEAFLAQCTTEFKETATTIVREWLARPGGRIRPNPTSQSISLDYPYDPGGTKQSLFVLSTNGQVTINRGYFRESVLDDDQLNEMDARLAQLFPGYKANSYYPWASHPQPASIAAFADWLIGLRR